MTIGPINVDCARLDQPDAETIDQLARLHLEVKRCGSELRLEYPSECLLELIGFCGLAKVLGVEPEGQPE